MKLSLLTAVTGVLVFSSVSFAQRANTGEIEERAQSLSNTNSLTITTPSSNFFANPSPLAGVKSYNDFGREQEATTPGQRTFKSKNEFALGGKLGNGFGLYGQAVEITNIYTPSNAGNNPKQNMTAPGDASVSLMHPIYNSDRLMLSGMLREYFPVSDRSVTQNIYQQAYYLNLVYKGNGGFDYFNQVIGRYFTASTYKPTDGVIYGEDVTTVSKKYAPWLRLGAGQQFQIEAHSGIPTGNTLEVFPYADFMISNSIFAGPRIYIPVSVQNSVYDAPTAVSANNIQAELYLQATL